MPFYLEKFLEMGMISFIYISYNIISLYKDNNYYLYSLYC